MGFGRAMHCEAGLCVLSVADVPDHCLAVAGTVRARSATYRGNVLMNRLMIEHVGGVQSGVPRRVVTPGANRKGSRIRPWRGEQRGQTAMCECNNCTYVSCPAPPPRQLISDRVSMLRHVYASVRRARCHDVQ